MLVLYDGVHHRVRVIRNQAWNRAIVADSGLSLNVSNKLRQ